MPIPMVEKGIRKQLFISCGESKEQVVLKTRIQVHARFDK